MAASSEHDAVDKIDLLHPEILSEDGLLELFKRRNVRVSISQSQSKEELVQLYYRTIIPMPQRTYRNNRRGKLMKQSQALIDKRNKRPKEQQVSDMFQTCFPTAAGSSSQPSLATPLLDRLKPPPEKTSVKGKLSLKAKPYGIGQDTENPLDRVVIKTFKKKESGDEQSVKTDVSESSSKDSQATSSRKRLLRQTVVPEPKVEDPLDKIVIKTFVKRKSSDSCESEVSAKRLAIEEDSNSAGTIGDHKVLDLKTTIDSVSKHLSDPEFLKELSKTEAVIKESKEVVSGSSLGKHPAELLRTDQGSESNSSSITPSVKKRKIKINRTSV